MLSFDVNAEVGSSLTDHLVSLRQRCSLYHGVVNVEVRMKRQKSPEVRGRDMTWNKTLTKEVSLSG